MLLYLGNVDVCSLAFSVRDGNHGRPPLQSAPDLFSSMWCRASIATSGDPRSLLVTGSFPRREPSAAALLFYGTAGNAADEPVEEEIVSDGHRDARDQRRRHQFTPVEDVASH